LGCEEKRQDPTNFQKVSLSYTFSRFETNREALKRDLLIFLDPWRQGCVRILTVHSFFFIAFHTRMNIDDGDDPTIQYVTRAH
jgi:hypothetical protein